MKQGYLKGTASFMIALILTLPIYSSFVLAVLSNGYIYGERDNVRGYYRRNENIYFNVTAWISGDSEISASQLHLFDLHGPIFNTCTDKGGGSFYCSYQMHSSSITESPYQQRVALYDDNDIFNSLFILNGAFDEEAPEINSFDIVPSIIGSGNVNFNYNIYEHSYSATDSNRCSGIGKIELSYKGIIFKTAIINSPPDQCSVSGAIIIPVSEMKDIEEGVVEVVLTVYDNFNQQTSTAAQFIYDTEAALVDTDSLEIKDNYGNSIDYIKDSINGVISFIVVSDDLDVNNVYGDISEINIDNIPSYNNKKATCIAFEEGYKCSFANIKVKLSQSTATIITIKASDLAGNMESTDLTKNIIYDNIEPSVTSIKTDKVDNSISYVGSLTTFIAELNEDGSGIDKDDIRLDLSNIKTGLSNKAADECTNSGSQWTCYWYNIGCDKGDGEKTISLSGSDKLGNPLAGTLSASVVVDKTRPVVISSDVTAVGVGVEAFEGYIKTNDILDVTLNVKEKNKLRAYADFSSFVTTQDNIAGSCIKEGEDNWVCDWSSSPIDRSGHRMGDINFNITDFSGNNIEHKETIEVLEYEAAVNVSYWTSTITCSPNLVDRQITNLVNQRVYCSITLTPDTIETQETLSINLGSCTDKLEGSLGYIENIHLLNAETGSTEPYLSVDLIKGEMTISKLSVICPLRIISRVGTKINKEPEIEPVKVDINFYNMPLGEYGEGIENKIKDAKDDAFGGIWKFLGFLKKIVSYSKLVCGVLRIIYRVKLIMQLTTAELTLAHLNSIGTPLQGVLGPIKTGACVSDNTAGEIAKASYGFGEGGLDQFCKFVNCQLSPPEATNPKTTKGTGGFWDIAKSIGGGHWFDQYMDWPITLPTGPKGNRWVEGTISEVTGKQYYQYANARDNLLVALATGCIPGIINGLEKLRQIKCLYADCLEQNAYNNVPVKVCEDQKGYATCKYIFGEIFAFLPWTALFDYYMGMIKGVLADPLSAIGLGLSFWCQPDCAPTEDGSYRWLYTQNACWFVGFASVLGEVINDVQGIIDDYEQIKGNYCERLEEDKEED